MKADEFDKKFDDGEDITVELDPLSCRRGPGHEQRRVNVDFPSWMIEALDREATRLGVDAPSPIIKVWDCRATRTSLLEMSHKKSEEILDSCRCLTEE